MKKTILVFSIILFFVACTNNDGNKQQSKEISNNSEKNSSSKEFSVYDSYLELENLFDKEETDNWTATYQSQVAWHNKVKANMVQFFDSIYPNKNLTDEEKVSKLIYKMKDAVESDTLGGSPGGINSSKCHPLQYDYLYYENIENLMKIVKNDSSFINEVKAWQSLDNALSDFYHHFFNYWYYGGSVKQSVPCRAYSQILKQRHYNLYLTCEYYEDIDNEVNADNYQNTIQLFKIALEEEVKLFIIRIGSIQYEYSEFTTEYEKEAIHDIQNYKAKVLIAFDNWIKQRHICERNNKEITFLTHYLIKDLSTIIIGLDDLF